MQIKTLICSILLLVAINSYFVSATGVSLINVNDTYATVRITNASNLYAYEINLDYSGSIPNITHSYFLKGSGHGWSCNTTNISSGDIRDDGLVENDTFKAENGDSIYCDAWGGSQFPNVRAVYSSRLDNTATGISGDGELFNVTHSGSVTLRYALFIDNQANEEYVYYNSTNPNQGGASVTEQKTQTETQPKTTGTDTGKKGGITTAIIIIIIIMGFVIAITVFVGLLILVKKRKSQG